MIQICAWWIKIREHNCSCVPEFNLRSRFCTSASLQVSCAGILLCYASHFDWFFLGFLFYCKPHFIRLISLFISLITPWSHLFGTDPGSETPDSCLSRRPICFFQFRGSGRGLQRSICLLSCPGSGTAAALLRTETFCSLPGFYSVSSCYSSSFPFLPVL